MARLELSDDDRAALREVLESAVSDLRYEINDTDSYDYRTKLRERLHALERVLEQLASD